MEALLEACDGEKDPRCLMASLALLKQAMAHFPSSVEAVADRLFDAAACYFPITFTPPPDDPFGISPEALTLLLEDCLCGEIIMSCG